MKVSMSKSRNRRTVKPSFPFGKSVIVSGGLIVAFMLFITLIADPRSGEIKSPTLAYSALGVTVLAVETAIYIEFRFLRKRRTANGGRIEKPTSGTGKAMKKSIPGQRRKIVFSVAGLFAAARVVPAALAGQIASGSTKERQTTSPRGKRKPRNCSC